MWSSSRLLKTSASCGERSWRDTGGDAMSGMRCPGIGKHGIGAVGTAMRRFGNRAAQVPTTRRRRRVR